MQLVKIIDDKDKQKSVITFTNKNTDYLVDTNPGKEGLKIKRKEMHLKKFECNPNTIEPMILNSFN